MNPTWILPALAILAGAGLRWLFLRAADGPAIRVAVNRIQAHLLEFWLFVDEPRTIWIAWKGLLAANTRLLGLLLVPFLILSAVVLPLFSFLDAFYGTSPLPLGKPALVTLGFDRSLSALPGLPELNVPAGILIDSPAVRVFSKRQVSWRIRPLRRLSGELRVSCAQGSWGKSVAAGERFLFHSRRRTKSVLEWILDHSEALLPAGPLQWIEISYPRVDLAFFGLEGHWSTWFIAFSLFGAILGRIANRQG